MQKNIEKLFKKITTGETVNKTDLALMSKYIFEHSIYAIRKQNYKWCHINKDFEISHFLSIAYTTVVYCIDKYRQARKSISLSNFTSYCSKIIMYEVNRINRKMLSNKNMIQLKSIPFEELSTISNNENLIYNSKIFADTNIDIEKETHDKFVFNLILETVKPQQKTILLLRLKGLSFDEIAHKMKLPRERVVYLFYSIRANPDVRRIYRDSKFHI